MRNHTTLRRRGLALAALALAALALALGSGATRGAPTTEPAMDFDDALLAYEVNHWQQAYAAFAALADRGHVEAARLALAMRRHGPTLYGTRFVATERQVERWSGLCTCAADSAAAPCQLALRKAADGL